MPPSPDATPTPLPSVALPLPLIGAETIARRVRQLGDAIGRDYLAPAAGGPPVLLALMDGACCFAADLMRALPVPGLRVVFRRASSYRGTASTGTVALEDLPDFSGARVLVVDDILDSGHTLACACAAVASARAAAVRTCVLLDKPARRRPGTITAADWTGFTIPDRFVVGYGLDYDGHWRHLPDVCILSMEP